MYGETGENISFKITTKNGIWMCYFFCFFWLMCRKQRNCCIFLSEEKNLTNIENSDDELVIALNDKDPVDDIVLLNYLFPIHTIFAKFYFLTNSMNIF